MEARDALAGAADGPFERIVHHLVVAGGLLPQGVAPDGIVGVLPGSGRLVAVIRARPEALDEVARLARGAGTVGAEIALVGGDAALGDALGDALPGFAPVSAWHVPDDGPPRRVAGALEARLEAFLEPPDAPPDWDRFWTVAEARVAEAEAELRAFQKALAGRPPRATQALVAAIVAIYVVGIAWGAPKDLVALLRMGAFERSLVLDGEVWRLLSSTLLHGSVMHLGFNAYVLWAIGSTLERLVGSSRFLVLYVASGLGGGLLSLAFMDGVGVGASGAIWGLMTAQLALVWRPIGLVPEPLRAPMRSGSLQTLVMNVLISFMPGIGWSAHFGGGLVGAGLAFGGALTHGLPRWAEERRPPPDRVPVAMRVGAWVAVGLLVASFLAALATGRPWES